MSIRNSVPRLPFFCQLSTNPRKQESVMVELSSVAVGFGTDTPVLEEIEMTLPPGEVAIVSGASGVGKSTLLATVFGTLTPVAGVVRVFGHDLNRLRRSSMARLRRRVAIVPQEITLLSNRTLSENVAIPLVAAGVPRSVAILRVAEALATVGLEDSADVLVDELSTGERRRVTVARAIVSEPQLLLADEPDAHLDSNRCDELCGILEEVRARGATVIVTSNHPQLLATGALCGWRGFELRRGRMHETVLGPESDSEMSERKTQALGSGSALPLGGNGSQSCGR